MAKLEVKTITVTTVQFMLIHHRGNQSTVAKLLPCNRATLRAMIDDGRENVVIINEDGSYKLLK